MLKVVLQFGDTDKYMVVSFKYFRSNVSQRSHCFFKKYHTNIDIKIKR